MATVVTVPKKLRRERTAARGETVWGWGFVSPALLGLVVFLAIPVIFAFYVSMRDWTGQTTISESHFVGLDNFKKVLIQQGLDRRDFALALRNNFYYVLFVVPAQTALAFFLAVVVNQKFLKGKSFFRTAFYFPSVTSSIAISLVFIFLFQPSGAANRLFHLFGLPRDQHWLDNPNGLIHNFLSLFGVREPAPLTGHKFMDISFWDWLSGPSMALTMIMILAVWTTTGTFMLMFLAGLQNIGEEVEEAAVMDGTNPWQRFRFVTLPMMKPTLFLVLTLGIIGTWQVFDQIYAIGGSSPVLKQIQTPAYLIYRNAFKDNQLGTACALAFLLFLLILVLTGLQKLVLRDKEATTR